MTIILEAVVGSQAYGLATEASDIDLLSVHVAKFNDVLGLNSHSVTTFSEHLLNPDSTSHELAKFCLLAMKANPSVTEILWAGEYTVCEPEGITLIENRKAFLSETAVKGAYGGFASSCAFKVAKHVAGASKEERVSDDRISKNGRHAFRVILQGEQLLGKGRLSLDVGDQKDFIFSMGELAVSNPYEFQHRLERKLARLHEMESKLPEVPDWESINEMVIAIRMAMVNAENTLNGSLLQSL
jgi:uncharacterized protein